MRVLLVSTSDTGTEPATAANRLMGALRNNGIKAKMLVRDKQTEQITVASVPQSPFSAMHSLRERISGWFAGGLRSTGNLDTGETGTDITSLPEFKEADIIHLHDVSDGFLSLKNIRSILTCGKPVVWTIHDQWTFTGICHNSGECTNYRTTCRQCPMLTRHRKNEDLSTATFRRKQQMLHNTHATFVASSQWLEDEARKSTLLTGQEVVFIPNTISTYTFHRTDKKRARLQCNLPADKKLILLDIPHRNITEKDTDALACMCRILKDNNTCEPEQICFVMTETPSDSIRNCIPFPIYIHVVDPAHGDKQTVHLYNAVDAYVTTSQNIHSPHALMEAMACGVPCVAFNSGCTAELVDHRQNGYLAEPGNTKDLAEGICLVTAPDICEELSAQCIHKIQSACGETHIASRYIAVYRRIADKR